MAHDLPRILVIDDEEAIRQVLSMRLPPWGFDIHLAENATEGRRLVVEIEPDIVLLDLSLPDDDGLSLLRWIKQADAEREVIMITAFGTIDAAVEAVHLGARDFLTKPLDYERLRDLLNQALQDRQWEDDRDRLEKRLDRRAGLGLLIGQSRPMKALYRTVELLAKNQASAIITGESGTGKELVARTIHQLSARREAPFVAVNVAAIPEGLSESELFGHERGAFTGAVSARAGWFEQASGGTLLLDEFGEMQMQLQPKFLRVLEESQVRRIGGGREIDFDVRILAATNRDPARAVESGRLREDLYYRLNVFTLEIPPLRKRADDIPVLAQHFLRLFNGKHGTQVEGLSATAADQLRDYPWPGNVRELRNVVEHATIRAQQGWIENGHLPLNVRRSQSELRPPILVPSSATLADAEKILILETLKNVDHNKAEAARRLGLDVKTIRNKLKAYSATGRRDPADGR